MTVRKAVVRRFATGAHSIGRAADAAHFVHVHAACAVPRAGCGAIAYGTCVASAATAGEADAVAGIAYAVGGCCALESLLVRIARISVASACVAHLSVEALGRIRACFANIVDAEVGLAIQSG
jgi:hypothetical protein